MALFLRGLLICLPLLLSSLSHAEQRFYQLVDPDGRVRIIKAPVESIKSGQGESSPAGTKSPDAVSGSASGADGAPQKKAPPENFAPYNGDEYLDSERLESSGFNPEQKSNFYIINDGLGARVEHGPESSTDAMVLMPSEPVLTEKGVSFPSEMEEIGESDDIRALLASKTLCVSSERLEKSKNFAKGRLYGVFLDKKAWRYQEPLGVLASYKFSADGMKTLTLRSYAKNEKDPEFAAPLLALADSSGCIRRIVTGYFQSRFEATKAKHSMLEGEVTIHADEPYLFVISTENYHPASTSYKRSQYGQLSIKWQP